jgi:hypothetical protein
MGEAATPAACPRPSAIERTAGGTALPVALKHERRRLPCQGPARPDGLRPQGVRGREVPPDAGSLALAA